MDNIETKKQLIKKDELYKLLEDGLEELKTEKTRKAKDVFSEIEGNL